MVAGLASVMSCAAACGTETRMPAPPSRNCMRSNSWVHVFLLHTVAGHHELATLGKHDAKRVHA